jgi:hypothetical protein
MGMLVWIFAKSMRSLYTFEVLMLVIKSIPRKAQLGFDVPLGRALFTGQKAEGTR